MNETGTDSRRPLLYVSAAVMLWPAIELIGGRLGARHEAIQVVWLRYSMHLVLLAAVCLPLFGRRAFATQRPGLQLLRGLLMFAMPMCYVLALGKAPSAWIWTVFWCAPLLVLCAAPLVRERAPATYWLAAGVAWIGALAILRPEAAGSMRATALALGMAAAFAGYLLVSRTLRNESIVASLFFTGAGALLPTTLIVPSHWRAVGIEDVAISVGLGVTSLLFLLAVDRALEDAHVGLVASLFVGVVIVETLLRQFLQNALARPIDIAGMVLIGSSALWLVRFSYRSAAAIPRLRQDA